MRTCAALAALLQPRWIYHRDVHECPREESKARRSTSEEGSQGSKVARRLSREQAPLH